MDTRNDIYLFLFLMFTFEKTHLFTHWAVFFGQFIINSVYKFYFQFDVFYMN